MEREVLALPWADDARYKQMPGVLPKLRIKEESNRRDSLSSERTGDSGYISDPEISLSPLDFGGQDNIQFGPALANVPSAGLPAFTFDPSAFGASKTKRPLCGPSVWLKIHRDAPPKALHRQRKSITSNPLPLSSPSNEDKPDWTNAFKGPVSESTPHNEDVEQWIKDNLPSQDRPKERVSSIVSLSSTGSGDMYSITDDSEVDEAVPDIIPNALSKATIKTIELILRKIELNLRCMAYIQCASGTNSRRQSATNTTSTSNRTTSQKANGGKRKSRSDELFPPDDPNDDDNPNKRRRVSVTTTEDSESGPRFACPFYKHDPNRYRYRRTCPGPGWPTVHRMKEHLYRSHTQSIFCPRCYSMFDADTELNTHLRTQPCAIAEPQPIEGINRETLTNLRKRSPPLRLEEDKWRDTYQLLFPEVEVADIPSPYYDTDSPSEESRRFRRELLERIRRELFATAEREAGPVEQNLLRQVAGIIQRCESEMLASTSFSSVASSSSFLAAGASQLQLPGSQNGSRRTSQTPRSVPEALASFSGDGYVEVEGVMSAGHQGLPVPQQQHVPPSEHPVDEAPIQFNLDFWNEPLVPSSNWIDWEAVFPLAPDMQGGERGGPDVGGRVGKEVWT